MHKVEFEADYNFEAVSSLEFVPTSKAQLLEKVNRYQLQIHIAGFTSLQMNCPNRAWQRLIKIYSNSSSQVYHLAAQHSLGKDGRSIVISSPLQVNQR